MKNLLVAASLAFLVPAVAAPAPVPATGQQQAQPKVEPSLSAACRKFNEDFNKFDPEAVAAHFTEDGTVISPAGQVGTGRQGVARVFGSDAKVTLEGSRSTFTILSARHLGPNLALLDLDQDVQGAKMPDGSRGATKLHVVILARRSGDGWLWVDVRPYAFMHPPQRPQ